MPKLPLYESQTKITTEVPGVQSNIQMPLDNTLAKIGASIADYYVKEKTAEADTNALKILSESYGNQADGTQGLYSINDELKKNGNPSEVSKLFDEKINTLWNNIQTNKLSEADAFTKKALQQKFFAQSAAFRQDTIRGSRDTLYTEQANVFGTFLQQQIVNLKMQGAAYLPTFNESIISEGSKIAALEPYQQQELIKTSINFGHKELGDTLLEKNSLVLKELIKNGSLKLDQKTFGELIDKADKKNQDNLFNQITIGLDYTPQSTMKKAGQEFNKIIDGKFDNLNTQNAYNSLSDSQKNDLKKEAIRKYNEFETIYKVRADDSRRLQADGSKKAVDNVIKKANADLYDPNLIKESFKGNEKLINDFNQINILSSKNELLDSSAYPIKYEIMKNISSGNVIDVGTPFRLTGESTPIP